MKELLTLQFGHYSNFVGTHLWNIQENSFEYSTQTQAEIDHDVLYREGLDHKNQVTFTPRVLIVDLKGSLKALPESGSLYEASSSYNIWPESLVEVKHAEKIGKNKFLQRLEEQSTLVDSSKSCDLDKEVKVWSDFLYARFHPRSVNIVKQFEHENDKTPFDLYTLGKEYWENDHFQEDFSDKIRQYVEECDNFQGFQVLLDATDAFAGLSAGCIQHLVDEYNGKSILTMPIMPPSYTDYGFTTYEEKQQSVLKDTIRVLNTALCFNSLAEFSSLVVPLSVGSKGWRQPGPKREFYHVNFQHDLPYHSSAILGSAIDTFTMKHRLKSSHFTLTDLCSDLSSRGKKVAAASICLPFSFNEDADLIECLDNWQGPLSKSITPSCNIGTDRLLQHITLRGVDESKLKKPLATAKAQQDLPAYKYDTVEDMLRFYLSCTTYATASNVTVVKKPLPTKLPYPNIFDSHVGINGSITINERLGDKGVDSVPLLTGLHCGGEVGHMIESLHTESRRIKISKLHQFVDLEPDEFSECLDRLFDLRECYEDNYQI